MFNRRQFLSDTPLGALAVLATLRSGAAIAAERDAITLSFPNDVPNWDPISASSPVAVSIQKCVFDMVFELSPKLDFASSVGKAHRWLDTEGKVLEISLRDDVTFHNGDKLTSDDVKFTFWDRPRADKTLMLSGTFGPARIADLETPSPTKVIFHFATPYVFAPKLLGSIPSYILPRGYFEKVGRDGFMAKPIGSGPYRLVYYERDSRIILQAYDEYWGGVAPIKNVTFQIIKDVSARVAAIEGGQVDFAHSIPVREALRLGKSSDLESRLQAISSDYLIQMVNKGPFQDRNLRLALHHAIDKRALSKALFAGQAVPISMWVPPGSPGNDPSFNFEYSQAKAKELLAAAGYGPKKHVKIPFLTTNGAFPSDFDLARAIAQMWTVVGIDVDLSVIDVTKYFELSRSDKLDAPALANWTASTGDPENWSGLILDPRKIFSVWKSDDIAPRLEPLYGEIDETKRIAGYRVFDRWAVEQGYAVPLLQSIVTVVHAKRLAYEPWLNGWMLPYRWHVS
jgi:peptide/nickel transport system substrate-binding protein